MTKNPHQKIVEVLNSSTIACQFEGLRWGDVYESATQRGLLKQLHAIFHPLAPSGSKIKSVYHHLNLRSAIKEIENSPIENQMCQSYLDYRINFGRKCVLVDQLDDQAYLTAAMAFNDLDSADWLIEPDSLLDEDTLEGVSSPSRIVKVFQGANGIKQILLEETEVTIYYGQPKLELLSDVGKEFVNSMKMQKRLMVTGFHKVIFDPVSKVRITLVDPVTLKNQETPTDKAKTILNYLDSRIGKSAEKPKAMAFFSAIQKIYDDSSVGRVIGGYFYTKTGSRFINSSKGAGTDLRSDPFQKGGESTSEGKPNFVKLEIEWPKLPGFPLVSLQGSSEMFEAPEHSLRWFDTTFSTAVGAGAEHLAEVFHHGS
jgi:hypothetical protein